MLKFDLTINTVDGKSHHYDDRSLDIEEAMALSSIFDGGYLTFTLESKYGSVEMFNVRNVVSIEYHDYEYEPCEDLPF